MIAVKQPLTSGDTALGLWLWNCSGMLSNADRALTLVDCMFEANFLPGKCEVSANIVPLGWNASASRHIGSMV